MTATDLHPVFAAKGTFAGELLGRKPKRDDPRTLHLGAYLDEASLLPQIPETFDYTPPLSSWPMYGNDAYGDCTCAAVGHMIETWSALAGTLETPTDDAVMALYWATGHPADEPCAPGGPTDDGRVELDVLNYWRKTGLGGVQIAAYVSVNPLDHDHVRAALYLFGGLYVGYALPRTAQGQHEWDLVGDGKTGDSAAGSWGGHAVPYLPVWDGEKLPLVTWGASLPATLAFHDAYCEEAYAVVSPTFLEGSSGESPEGFDLDALKADLEALR